MATTIEQQAFLVMADVPEIYMQEFWATATVHQHSIRFKMDTRKHIVDLESFREMLHISLRVSGQSFAELPFEEEILEFLRHQNTQQYGVILPIELTTEEIRNTKAYKKYYACATREAAPKPKASARMKRGGSDSSTTPPTAVASPRPITTVAAAPRLTAAAKGKQPARATTPKPKVSARRKRSGSDTSITPPTAITTPTTTIAVTPRLTAAAKGKQPAKAKSPSGPSELAKTEAQQLKIILRRSRDDDDDDEEIAKTDEQDDAERGGDDDKETKSDEESNGDETREEESFDPIPKTSEDSEDDGNGEEDQGLRISEEERLHEEEEADELYRDVDINQGRGLQLSQDIEDSHMTLTLVHPDGQQESSSVSS
nr:hypothetical protein [Tanacetum cinerariifolium]